MGSHLVQLLDDRSPSMANMRGVPLGNAIRGRRDKIDGGAAGQFGHSGVIFFLVLLEKKK